MLRFMTGLFIGLSVASAFSATQTAIEPTISTNGTLVDYVVQKDGVDICKDPLVWVKPFRADSPNGYIVCDE